MLIKYKEAIWALGFFFLLCSSSLGQVKENKTSLSPGLVLWEFKQVQGNNLQLFLIILQADQKKYSLQLISAKKEGQGRSLEQWAKKFNLVAAINASMFWQDQKTSTGYMKDYNFINNKLINPSYGGFLVFHPKSARYQSVKIVDKVLDQDWQEELERYNTIVQNFRMISHGRASFWEKSEKRYSIAAIGLDRQSQILFILSSVPTTINQLITFLLDLPIPIDSCLFAEGGSRAGLYLRLADKGVCWYGRAKGQFLEVQRILPSQIPNVIGLINKE